MKRRLGRVKKILLGFAAMVLLGIVVLAGVAYFVDIESLKAPLIRKLSDASGMKVEIDELAYDFHDGFGLKADGVNIESMDGKEKFVSAKSLFVHVYLMPLLAGKVDVKTIDLIQPVVTVYLDKKTPAEKKEEAEDKKTDDAESQTVVNSIRDTFLNFELAIRNIGIEQGRIYLIKRRNGKPVDQQMMRVSGITQISRPNREQLNLTLDDISIRLGKLHLQGDIVVREVLTKTATLEARLKLGSFSAKDLKNIYFFFPEDPSETFAAYAPQGNIELLQLEFKAPLDSLEDGEAFHGQSDIAAHVVGNAISFRAAGRTFPIEHMDSRVAWRKRNLNHNLKLRVGAGSVHQQGDVRFSGNDTPPVLNTTLRLNNMELNRLGFPEVSKWAQGLVSGTLHLSGPASLNAMTANASLSGDELLITPPDMQVPLGRWQADAALKERNLHSTLKVTAFGGEVTQKGDLTFPASDKDAWMLDSTVSLTRVDATQLPIPKAAGIQQGTLSGTVDATGPANDPDKLTYQASLVGDDFRLTVKDLDNMTLPIQRVDANATLKGRTLRSTIKAAVLNGELTQDGDIILPDSSKKNSVTELDSDFKLKSLDLSQVKWPAGWGLIRTVLSGNVKATGPFAIDRIKLRGTLQGEKMVLVPQDHHFSIQDAIVKVNSKPPKVPVTLSFKLTKVNAKGYPFNRITGEVALPKDKVVLSRSAFVPPNGTLGIKGAYNIAKQKYDFSFGGKGLSIEDYEKKHLKGIMKFVGTLKGHIPKEGPATQGLNGDLQLLVTEGSLKELGAVKAILTILNPTALQKLSDKGLLFDRMGGTFQIKKGVVTTPQVGLEGKYLKVYLKGTADLNTEKLDMHGKALPMGDLDKILQGVPLLGKLVAGSKTDEGLVETYFKLEGSFSDPKVDMETAKSLFAKPKRILETLGDLLTGGAITGK